MDNASLKIKIKITFLKSDFTQGLKQDFREYIIFLPQTVFKNAVQFYVAIYCIMTAHCFS